MRRGTGRRRGSPSGRSPRRELVWASSTGLVSFTAAGQFINLDLLQTYKSLAGAETAGITIMRAYGWVVFQAPVAADSFYVGCRVGDLKQATAAVGAVNATIPNSRDDPYVNWSYLTRALADANGQFGLARSNYQGLTFDITSKRRMHLLQQAWMLSLTQDAVGTVAKACNWYVRTLIALP